MKATTKKVTAAQAKKVLAAVRANWQPLPGYGPTLVKDFQGQYADYPWAIVWEGGPFGWTYTSVTVPGVWTEAVNHYALAIYPK